MGSEHVQEFQEYMEVDALADTIATQITEALTGSGREKNKTLILQRENLAFLLQYSNLQRAKKKLQLLMSKLYGTKVTVIFERLRSGYSYFLKITLYYNIGRLFTHTIKIETIP